MGERHAEEFLLRVAVALHGGGVHREEVLRAAVVDPRGKRHHLEQAAVVLLTARERLLLPPSLRHVRDEAHGADQRPVAIVQGRREYFGDEGRAVLATVLQLVPLPHARAPAREALLGDHPVFRQEERLADVGPHELAHVVAGTERHLLVHVHRAMLEVCDHEARVHVFGERAKTGFRPAQCGRVGAGGEAAQGAEIRPVVEWRDHRFHGDAHAVRSPQPRHGALRARSERREVDRCGDRRLRMQHLAHRASRERVAVPAGERAGGRVCPDHPVRRVEDEHPVTGSLEQRLEVVRK